VGDVVLVQAGDAMEADGVLLEGFEVDLDESAVTGESELQRKDGGYFLTSGSYVQNGQGTYLVVAVGVHSERGKVQLALNA